MAKPCDQRHTKNLARRAVRHAHDAKHCGQHRQAAATRLENRARLGFGFTKQRTLCRVERSPECRENVVFFGGPHLGQRHLQTVCRDRAAQSLALSFLRSATSDSRASNSLPDCRCVSGCSRGAARHIMVLVTLAAFRRPGLSRSWTPHMSCAITAGSN